MDTTAFTLSKENKLPIIVFDINIKGNLIKVVSGKRLGLEYSHKFNIMEDDLNIINNAEESMRSAINH